MTSVSWVASLSKRNSGTELDQNCKRIYHMLEAIYTHFEGIYEAERKRNMDEIFIQQLDRKTR